MPALSNYAENLVINLLLRGVSPTVPSAWFMALYTSNPTAADTGTEISFSGGTNYSRQPITFGVPSSGVSANTGDITFPVAGINWGTITHAAIRDDATTGNLLVYGSLVTPKFVGSGDVLKFLIGNVTITVS